MRPRRLLRQERLVAGAGRQLREADRLTDRRKTLRSVGLELERHRRPAVGALRDGLDEVLAAGRLSGPVKRLAERHQTGFLAGDDHDRSPAPLRADSFAVFGIHANDLTGECLAAEQPWN